MRTASDGCLLLGAVWLSPHVSVTIAVILGVALTAFGIYLGAKGR